MNGLLGNFKGRVKPWYLPFDWVFCRISINYKTKVIIVRNGYAPNIYDLPVYIHNGKVVKVRNIPSEKENESKHREREIK